MCERVMRDALGLKINCNARVFADALPVTLRFADADWDILTAARLAKCHPGRSAFISGVVHPRHLERCLLT